MSERRNQNRATTKDFLTVVDVDTGLRLGGLANVSDEGAMIVSEEAITVGKSSRWSIDLDQPILGRLSIPIEVKTRWCRKNLKRGWWESGHTLKCATNDDRETLSYLVLRFSLGEWDIPGTRELRTVPMPNRRKHARFETTDFFPVRDQNSSCHIGGLANLTPVGAMLTSVEPIKEGTILRCRVELPQKIFQRDYLFFEAECRWCKQNSEKGWYESGYKFTKITEQDAVIIMHLMMHHLNIQTTEEQVDLIG